MFLQIGFLNDSPGIFELSMQLFSDQVVEVDVIRIDHRRNSDLQLFNNQQSDEQLDPTNLEYCVEQEQVSGLQAQAYSICSIYHRIGLLFFLERVYLLVIAH